MNACDRPGRRARDTTFAWQSGGVHPAVADALNRWNAAHPWSHNDHYARWLLRRLPRTPGSTLDVGCGTGGLVRAFAGRGARAHGIDADPRVVAAARDVRPQVPGATFAVGDALDLGGRRYDVVTAVAVLHHLPAEEALTRWRDALAPGGTLVVVGCYRDATLADRLVGTCAVPANALVGLLRRRRAEQARVAMSAPTQPAAATLAEVRECVARVLPGARVRRRLFWRWTLVHRAPV